ncbi:hypothetical protein TTHERM_01302840 (macronuclear) [Tetrahymena thermophila SB210]|uniref:Uncharacterized protein n=1 Tax=Tetrahymena thermophila (strain SB210) TaxID=312017 RepID=Q232B5_TETTS|nr:hypothetical protein TTHERM_01302840 [Tetrahymena thermophila SB210]EAR91377.2 hypothetical protein TTHERM_01302840 [Tetrahymena thermophila SB210]|eukprot:XP_001011622.2 hypothetical protein TTHERM_01302840 [Tetrahymena thermophila SB210]
MGQDYVLCLCQGHEEFNDLINNEYEDENQNQNEDENQNQNQNEQQVENEKIYQDQDYDEIQQIDEEESGPINHSYQISQEDQIFSEEIEKQKNNNINYNNKKKQEIIEEEESDCIEEQLTTQKNKQLNQNNMDEDYNEDDEINKNEQQFSVYIGQNHLKNDKNVKNQNIFNRALYNQLQSHVILQQMTQIKSSCFCFYCEQYQIINLLSKNQKNMKIFNFQLSLCPSFEIQLKKNLDYFDLKSKQNLLEIGFCSYVEINQNQIKLVCDQLENNMGSINTICLQTSNTIQKQQFYKLSRLVNFSSLEY